MVGFVVVLAAAEGVQNPGHDWARTIKTSVRASVQNVSGGTDKSAASPKRSSQLKTVGEADGEEEGDADTVG